MSLALFTEKQPETVTYAVCIGAAIGKLLVGLNEDGLLCRVAFAAKGAQRDVIAEWQKEWPQTRFVKDKKEVSFSALKKKDILLVGTPFQHRVWAALLDIDEGETMSYGEMADYIGASGAARAVGTALGKNPVPLLVPCHRVLAANQKIGGFSGGAGVKQKLLALEGATFKE
jgi:methylated-DNA-[protein]-cysteine S-methyltransferase